MDADSELGERRLLVPPEPLEDLRPGSSGGLAPPALRVEHPIDWGWFVRVSEIPNAPVRTAVLLHLLRGLQACPHIKMEYRRARDLGMSRHVVYRELKQPAILRTKGIAH